MVKPGDIWIEKHGHGTANKNGARARLEIVSVRKGNGPTILSYEFLDNRGTIYTGDLKNLSLWSEPLV